MMIFSKKSNVQIFKMVFKFHLVFLFTTGNCYNLEYWSWTPALGTTRTSTTRLASCPP